MPSVHLSAPSGGHRASGPSSGHAKPSGFSPTRVPAKEPAASGTPLPAHTPVSHPTVAQPADHPSGAHSKPPEPYPTGGGLPKPTTHHDDPADHPDPPHSTPAGHHENPAKLGPADAGMHEPTSLKHPNATSADSDIPQSQVYGPAPAPPGYHDPATPAFTYAGPGASSPPDPHSIGPASQGPTFILHNEPAPRPSVADHLKDIGWDMAGGLATGVIGAGLDIGAHAAEDQIDQNYADANQDQDQDHDQDEEEDQGQGQDPDDEINQLNQAAPPVQHAVVAHPTYSTGDQADYDEFGHEDGHYPEYSGVHDDYYADGGLDAEHSYDDQHNYDESEYYPDDGITGDQYDHYGYSEHDPQDHNGGYGDPSAVGHGAGAGNQALELEQHA